MVRNIALGILIAAITPTSIANSTAIIIDNKPAIDAAPLTNDRPELSFSCRENSLSAECFPQKSAQKPTAYSGSWMERVTELLLERPPFLNCTWRSRKPSNNIFALLPEQSEQFSGNSSWNSNFSLTQFLSKANTPPLNNFKCQALQQPAQNKAFSSPTVASKSNRSSWSDRPLSSISQANSDRFPKLTRSSLIVDFPQENSTFIPQNNKLVNPAPATERIASPFGWRRRPYSNQLQFHQGIDYGAPYGSPVVAAGNGIVTKVVSGCMDFGNLFCGNQFGNWIEIDHGNGAIGIYGHLKNSSIVVEEGMKVRKNQNIALVGSSGWSTGAHLDFRLKIDGKHQDPTKYIEQ